MVTVPELFNVSVIVPPLVIVAPELLVTPVAVKDPPTATVRVAELLTVPAFCVVAPIASVPAEMVQFREVVLGPPVNVHVLVPFFANCPNPWYFVPTCVKSNVLLVEPPSPFLGTVHLDALPYRNVDLKKFYPYGEPVFPN